MKSLAILLAAAGLAAVPALAQETPNTPRTTDAQGTMGQTTTGQGSSMTAQPPGPMTDAETRTRTRLSEQGYSDLQNMEREGEGWKGTAMHGGQRYAVKVDANGRVTRTPMPR
jgi:hypothetical protein